MQLEYSIMRYCLDPFYYRDEDKSKTIPLGILIHEKEKDIRKFLPISDLSEVEEKDSDIDIIFLRAYLDCIDSDIKELKDFEIRSYTKYFVNAFKFDQSKTVQYTDFEEKIKQLFNEMK